MTSLACSVILAVRIREKFTENIYTIKLRIRQTLGQRKEKRTCFISKDKQGSIWSIEDTGIDKSTLVSTVHYLPINPYTLQVGR